MKRRDIQAAVDAGFESLEMPPWLGWSRVSDRHKYVAFMAAKAACTTIKLALHHFETPDVEVEPWWHIHVSHPAPSLADYSPDAVVEMLSSDKWFRFCVVRNPYDRLVSAWKQKLVSDNDDGYAWLREEIRAASGRDADSPIAFRDSVQYLLTNDAMAGDAHWIPMCSTMRPDIVDYHAIGRFEKFQSDFASILRSIGAPPEVVSRATVVSNATAGTRLTDVYDEAVADRVYAHYEDDFAAFGYAKDSWTHS
jgi:hypothetical protein